ncbi:MAG: TVP38/TMEM64 family protein [Lamprobacter sp.]|uniref:TVP38/TMEM64 family protein n=1 Tax=Lamprobacter sp. TaxID=3100796 RepID=UPI002B2566F8|nr:TVP38/TMEM64 family protein [Lamprobacter sp.]MEA3643951.1 TVP38/TMEM64 family protein [Lamprobacter sp.]
MLIVMATLFVAAIVGLLFAFDIDSRIVALLGWINEQGALAQVWFVLLMAGVVLLMLPGVLFTTGAGFVFGVVEGTLYVVVGTTIGACIAFLLARYLAGARARQWLRQHDAVWRLNRAIERDDARVVLLTRLIPFFPGKASNYAFGLSAVSFRGYALGTLIGLVPFSLHNVYLGSFAASLLTLDERNYGRTPVEWAIYVLGFAATVVAVIYFNRLARTELSDTSTQTAPSTQSGGSRS